jgi:hypothetical protein
MEQYYYINDIYFDKGTRKRYSKMKLHHWQSNRFLWRLRMFSKVKEIHNIVGLLHFVQRQNWLQETVKIGDEQFFTDTFFFVPSFFVGGGGTGDPAKRLLFWFRQTFIVDAVFVGLFNSILWARTSVLGTGYNGSNMPYLYGVQSTLPPENQ